MVESLEVEKKETDKIHGRNALLDCAKGVAIMLVVFGHEIEMYFYWHAASGKAYGQWYWQAIYFFHMALFIFISGYLAFGKLDFKFLQRRTLQLMLPFFFWSIVLYYSATFWFTGLQGVYPVKTGLITSVLYCLLTLNITGLWFLPLLLALYFITWVGKRHFSIVIGIVLLSYLISQLPWPSWSVFNHQLVKPDWFNRIAWFMPFFISGYFVSKYKKNLKRISYIKWFALIAFPVFFIIGRGLDYIPQYAWPAYSVFARGDVVFGFYGFLMAFLGIGMVFAIVELIMRASHLSVPWIYLGQITLAIYCSANLSQNIGVFNGIWWMLSASFISILFSVALIWLLQKLKATDYMFLGGAQKLIKS